MVQSCFEENSVVKYGIVGVGMMGREHILNLSNLQDARVVAIADTFEPSRQAAIAIAESVHITQLKVFEDHKALMDSGCCDVIVISTPNMTHASILLDILKHPRTHHVLVEKPLCTTIASCKQVLEAAKGRPDILLQVGLEYRYMPPVARLIKEVKSGAVGSVKMVAIREHRFPFLVKVHNWNRFNKNTGGTLVEKCCHFFDLMNLIIGPHSEPVRVLASGSQDVNHLDEVYDGKVPDIIDNAYVIVEYSNGARGMLDLCMFAEGSQNEQEICVTGNIGKVEAFVPDNIVRVGKRSGGKQKVESIKVYDNRIKYEGLHHGSSYLEHLEFIESVKTHGEHSPAVSLYDGLLSVAVGVAAQKSIELGRVISLNEVFE